MIVNKGQAFPGPESGLKGSVSLSLRGTGLAGHRGEH